MGFSPAANPILITVWSNVSNVSDVGCCIVCWFRRGGVGGREGSGGDGRGEPSRPDLTAQASNVGALFSNVVGSWKQESSEKLEPF